MEEIYRAHFGFVWAVLRRLGVDERDLEDVAHDVFVVVHRRLAEFEGRAAIRTWLYAIALRVAQNHRRKHKPREPTDDALLVASRESDPEEHTVRSQAGRLLDQLLERLDDDKRAVFVLSELEGLTALEIAEIVGANPRTVYSRLRAARDRVHGDLARLHAREHSANERRQWLRAASVPAAPADGAERRVWAALLLKLPATTSIAAIGVGTTVHAITLSVAIGCAGLGALFVATSPLRADVPSEAAKAPAPQAAAAPAPDDAHPPPREPSAPAIAEPEAIAPADAIAPEEPEPHAAAPRIAPRAAKPPAHAPPDDALARELEALAPARAALARGDTAAALAAAEAHAKLFPDGAMAPERDRILAQGRSSQLR